MDLALRYTTFAVLAIIANLLAQHATGVLYRGPGELWLALVIGTGVGLLVKYHLDKRWIFGFRPVDLGHDVRTFVIYTVTGVATTGIFWGTEFLFDLWFGSRAWRYAGGALGLSVGYLIKYRLDRRYTFQAPGP